MSPALLRCGLAIVLTAIACAPAVFSATLTESAAAEKWTIDRFAWQGALGSARVVAVENRHGDIRVRRGGDDDDIALLAVLQHAEDEASPPRVAVAYQDDRIVIEVEMPERSAFATPRDEDRRRVDISLFLPSAVQLEARTTTGLIDAKKLASDVVAASIRGEIRVSTSGSLDLESAHGPIVATVLGDVGAPSTMIETQTGSIEMWLPEGLDAEVVAETSGLMTTDFSVDIVFDSQTAQKHATAHLGAALQTIRLSSAKGDIRMLRSAIPLRARADGAE